MFVRFWGTRGSIPSPGPLTAIYGGNTSCVEVRAAGPTTIILDCGTGIRALGAHLEKSGALPERIYLLIGHTHWDHIQGFPFFAPAFLPETEINIFAPAGFQRSLEDSLSGQMQYAYFPVKLADLPSHIHYTELEEGFFRIGEVLVETQYLNHTAPTIAYRITSGGATLAYVTDHEPFWNSQNSGFRHPGDQRHIEFLARTDLVIHDAQYTVEEYKSKAGWGHSTVAYATDVALAAQVSRLALYHHDPTHSDEMVRGLAEGARARVAAIGSPLDVFAAAEGMELELPDKETPQAIAAASALERRPIQGSLVLVVTDTPADIEVIEQALAEDGLVVSASADSATALERIRALAPHLVILDSRLADGDGARFIQPIRSSLKNPRLPILVLTEDPGSIDPLHGAESVAIDYLAKPFSPPMLRTRVRAWLARTATSTPDPTPCLEAAPAPEVPPLLNVLQPDDDADTAGATLFRPLAGRQFDKLMAQGTRRSYAAGHVVFRQGEPGDNVYVILSGRVRIVEALADNPVEMFLGELGPGEVFGEMAILRERPRSATVVALERTSCLVVPERDFLEALQAAPEMSTALLRVLAGRLYNADRLLARYAPDPLTGLPGRRAFHELYRRLAAGARRRGSSVLLLVLDVTHLKSINDRFGYKAGDDVLRTVADALVESSRSTDLVARCGGDEFVALLVEAGLEDTARVSERVVHKLERLATERGLPGAVACRIGFAVSDNPPDNADELLRAADENMQQQHPAARPR